MVTINTGTISDSYFDLCCCADKFVLHHKFCLCLVVMATHVRLPLPWEMSLCQPPSTPTQTHCSHACIISVLLYERESKREREENQMSVFESL